MTDNTTRPATSGGDVLRDLAVTREDGTVVKSQDSLIVRGLARGYVGNAAGARGPVTPYATRSRRASAELRAWRDQVRGLHDKIVRGRRQAYLAPDQPYVSAAAAAFAFPGNALLTSWFEDDLDFGGGDWPCRPSAGTSGLRPAMTPHNTQPSVSTVAYNGHHPPAFDGVVNDMWGNPAGAILMSDIVSASYGEIHFLLDTDGPLAAPAANPYDDVNAWSDGTSALTMGFSQNNPGTGAVASAYIYDGTTYNITPPATWGTGGPNRGRVVWDGVNLTLNINGTAGISTIPCGPAAVLTGSLTFGTARTLWWGPGRLISFLSANTPLGSTFDANLVAYWNAKFGLALT